MSDLSELVLSQLATLNGHLAGIVASLGTPHYKVVYSGPLPVAITPIDVQKPGGSGVHQLADVICHENITSTQTGSLTRETATAGTDPFGPGDQADADADAYANLKVYGTQWCSKGSCAGHGTQTCKPKLSDVKSPGYQTTSAPKAGDPTKKIWTLTATVSANISCTCQY